MLLPSSVIIQRMQIHFNWCWTQTTFESRKLLKLPNSLITWWSNRRIFMEATSVVDIWIGQRGDNSKMENRSTAGFPSCELLHGRICRAQWWPERNIWVHNGFLQSYVHCWRFRIRTSHCWGYYHQYWWEKGKSSWLIKFSLQMYFFFTSIQLHTSRHKFWHFWSWSLFSCVTSWICQ